MKMKINFIICFLTLFMICYKSYSKNFYYYVEGDIRRGYRITGKGMKFKPDSNLYAISQEDDLGRKRKITFFKNGKAVEIKYFNKFEKVIIVEGKSFYSKNAWFQITYIYRDKGIDTYKKLVKEVDYRIYKNRDKSEIYYREVTHFVLAKYNGKLWNIMKKREFFPRNKFHHYWIYIYPNPEAEKPSKILEYNVSNKLTRIGKYITKNGRDILIFKGN